MTKEAIRKREYRANKESSETSANRKAKNNAATKNALDAETDERREQRLANNRLNKDKTKENQTNEEILAKTARESAQRQARRLAAKEKAAKLTEFHRIQTPPKALQVTKKTHEGRLPHRNDGTLSSGGSGLTEDSMSEYEKLRQQNIEENKRKFQQLFGINYPLRGGPSSAPNQKRRHSKSKPNSELSDEEMTPEAQPTRKQPKRICKSTRNEILESSASDSSFETYYVDDLVESSVNAIDIETEKKDIVYFIVEEIVSLASAGPKFEYARAKKGQPKIGRKSKDAKRMAITRYVVYFYHFFYLDCVTLLLMCIVGLKKLKLIT